VAILKMAATPSNSCHGGFPVSISTTVQPRLLDTHTYSLLQHRQSHVYHCCPRDWKGMWPVTNCSSNQLFSAEDDYCRNWLKRFSQWYDRKLLLKYIYTSIMTNATRNSCLQRTSIDILHTKE